MRRGQILALFVDELDVGCEREKGPRDLSLLSQWKRKRVGPLTESGRL